MNRRERRERRDSTEDEPPRVLNDGLQRLVTGFAE